MCPKLSDYFKTIIRNQPCLQRALTYSNIRKLSLSSHLCRRWQRCSVDGMLKWIDEKFHLTQKVLVLDVSHTIPQTQINYTQEATDEATLGNSGQDDLDGYRQQDLKSFKFITNSPASKISRLPVQLLSTCYLLPLVKNLKTNNGLHMLWQKSESYLLSCAVK